MRSRRWLLLGALLALYLGAVALVAGVLAVPLHRALVAALGDDVELRRTVYRLAQLVALAGLVPLLALTGGCHRRDFALVRGSGPGWPGALAAGFAAGVASLGLLALVLLATGLRVAKPGLALDASWLAGALLGGMVTAVSVSILEELWFRGGLHTLAERISGPVAAIAGVSLVYAALHFVRPPSLPAGAGPGPLDGLALLAGAFTRFSDGAFVGPFLTLVAVGTILGLARVLTGSLAACIGLHAGWVLVIRVLKSGTELTADPRHVWLVDGYDGVIGWLALPWFAALAWLLARHVARVRAGVAP